MIQRYNISDRRMQALCAAACAAKGHLWNIFFGWRQTWYDGEVEVMEFLLPPSLYNDLLWVCRYYFREDV